MTTTIIRIIQQMTTIVNKILILKGLNVLQRQAYFVALNNYGPERTERLNDGNFERKLLHNQSGNTET